MFFGAFFIVFISFVGYKIYQHKKNKLEQEKEDSSNKEDVLS
jgi:amino acid permease